LRFHYRRYRLRRVVGLLVDFDDSDIIVVAVLLLATAADNLPPFIIAVVFLIALAVMGMRTLRS